MGRGFGKEQEWDDIGVVGVMERKVGLHMHARAQEGVCAHVWK